MENVAGIEVTKAGGVEKTMNFTWFLRRMDGVERADCRSKYPIASGVFWSPL